jgi:PD-(D/E)XK nuclease superfamily
VDHGNQGVVRAPGHRGRPREQGRHSPDEPKAWHLSPSDLFLWKECPSCLYRKVVHGLPRPPSPFPKVFGVIDRAMKDCYVGGRAEELIKDAPRGFVTSPDRWVTSVPLSIPGCDTPCVIRGRVDALIDRDDGSVGVIDFKTSDPSASSLAIYSHQLHCYAAALEHPARGAPVGVSSLGLLTFCPSEFHAESEEANLSGVLRYAEVPRSDASLCEMLAGVIDVLDAPEPPAPPLGCKWCRCLGRPLDSGSPDDRYSLSDLI